MAFLEILKRCCNDFNLYSIQVNALINMGICGLKRVKIITDTTNTPHSRNSLQAMRESIINQIHYLQHLSLNCKSDIETCIFETNPQLAILIKAKQALIKDKSQQLKNFINEIDRFDEKPKSKSQLQLEFFSKAQKSLKEISSNLLFQNISLATMDNLKYLRVLKDKLDPQSFDEKRFKSEIESKMQIKTVLQSTSGAYKRRKFVKAHQKVPQ